MSMTRKVRGRRNETRKGLKRSFGCFWRSSEKMTRARLKSFKSSSSTTRLTVEFGTC